MPASKPATPRVANMPQGREKTIDVGRGCGLCGGARPKGGSKRKAAAAGNCEKARAEKADRSLHEDEDNGAFCLLCAIAIYDEPFECECCGKVWCTSAPYMHGIVASLALRL